MYWNNKTSLQISKLQRFLLICASCLPGIMLFVPILKGMITTKTAAALDQFSIVIIIGYVIQILLLITVSTLVGLFGMERNNLTFGFLENGKILNIDFKVAFKWGLLCGALLVAFDKLLTSNLGISANTYLEIVKILPLKIFYGGVVEEILCRMGLMTAFLWGLNLISIKKVWNIWGAIALSSLIFGIGHLPMYLSTVANQPELLVIFKIIVLNFVGGLIFGYVFANYNLLSAMISHASAHVFMSIYLLIKLFLSLTFAGNIL